MEHVEERVDVHARLGLDHEPVVERGGERVITYEARVRGVEVAEEDRRGDVELDLEPFAPGLDALSCQRALEAPELLRAAAAQVACERARPRRLPDAQQPARYGVVHPVEVDES